MLRFYITIKVLSVNTMWREGQQVFSLKKVYLYIIQVSGTKPSRIKLKFLARLRRPLVIDLGHRANPCYYYFLSQLLSLGSYHSQPPVNVQFNQPQSAYAHV